MESICESLKHIDTRGYLIMGLMMLLFVIVISYRLIYVDTILLEKSFVFWMIIVEGVDCFPSG